MPSLAKMQRDLENAVQHGRKDIHTDLENYAHAVRKDMAGKVARAVVASEHPLAALSTVLEEFL